jgi:hypothetical protein
LNHVNPLAVVVVPKAGSTERKNVSKLVTKTTKNLLISTNSKSVNVRVVISETEGARTVNLVKKVAPSAKMIKSVTNVVLLNSFLSILSTKRENVSTSVLMDSLPSHGKK